MSDSNLGVIVAGAIASSGSPQKTFRGIAVIAQSLNIVANITVRERHHDMLEITQHPVEQGASVADNAFMRPAEVTLDVGWSESPNAPASLGNSLGSALFNKFSGAIQNALTGAAQKAIGGSAIGNLAVSKLGSLISNPLASIGASINNGKGKGTSAMQDIYTQLRDLQKSRVLFDVYTGKRVYRNMLMASITTETDFRTEKALMATLVCQEVILVDTKATSVTASPIQQASPEKTAPPADDGTKQLAQPSAETTRQALLLQASYGKS